MCLPELWCASVRLEVWRREVRQMDLPDYQETTDYRLSTVSWELNCGDCVLVDW